MKTRAVPLLAAACLTFSTALAQTTGASAPISSAAQATVPDTSLGLGATETLRTFDFTLNNSSNSALTVIGVQTTANLYVTDFSKTIPANGSGVISLLFSASANSTGPSDFLHVLTNQGDRVFQFDHNRAQAVQISPTTLSWAVGDPLTPKTITLTITNNLAVVAGIGASGTGNTATVQPSTGGQYVVTVVPGSTSSANKFIVSITLNPSLPGVVPVILCTVGSQ
jgi:hypothetical protein